MEVGLFKLTTTHLHFHTSFQSFTRGVQKVDLTTVQAAGSQQKVTIRICSIQTIVLFFSCVYIFF